MAVALVGTGGIFTRLGRFLGEINAINTQRSTTLDAAVISILSQYLSSEQDVVGSLTSNAINYYQTPTQFLNSLQTQAVNTVIQQVNEDTPLTSLTLTAALKVLISQMQTSVDSLDEPTVSIATAANSANYGNAVLSATLLDTDGLNSFYVFPEVLNCTITSDAGLGATKYQESASIVGIPSVDQLSAFWPQGSGANLGISAVNGAVNGILTNSNFTTWTANIPDSWVVSVGTPVTTFGQGTPYRGTYSYQIIGNGSQLTAIYQTVTLQPNTVYAISYWAKRSSGAAAGVLRFRLTNGSNTTITDDAGNGCTSSVTVSSGYTTSYVNHTVFFVTPKILPSVVRFFIELTTAVTNAETVDISLVGFAAASRLYQAGPFCALFSGSTQSALNDTYTITVANNGGTTHFVPAINRLLNLTGLGLKIPTNSSGSISDALITI